MENYEEKHKEDLEDAKRWLAIAKENDNNLAIQILEDFFPELKESEDEKIRKNIIDYFRYERKTTEKEITEFFIPWLEKQGEQNQKHFELKAGHWYICHRAYCCRADHLTVKEGERFMCEKDGVVKGFVFKEPEKYFKEICAPASMDDEQKPADKIEPKFKVGDWIVKQYLSYPFVIVDIKNDSYILNDIEGNKYEETIDFAHKVFHLWTIQDAKDGDVLAEDSCIFIIQKLGNNNTAKTYCTLYDDGDFDNGSILSFDIDSTKPATKEQRDTLMEAMADAGYTFDFEKKELKNIEQKPSWSEKDEVVFEDILLDLADRREMFKQKGEDVFAFNTQKEIAWLKSLKDRVQPQPKQEWSEEDEDMIKDIACNLERMANGIISILPSTAVKYAEQLKSLKPNHWKPSEEQLNSLGRFIEGVYDCVDFTNIKSLYNDLKKL